MRGGPLGDTTFGPNIREVVEVRVKCPICGKKIEVEDIHRPIYCSNCGTLFEIVFATARVLDRVADVIDKGMEE